MDWVSLEAGCRSSEAIPGRVVSTSSNNGMTISKSGSRAPLHSDSQGEQTLTLALLFKTKLTKTIFEACSDYQQLTQCVAVKIEKIQLITTHCISRWSQQNRCSLNKP